MQPIQFALKKLARRQTSSKTSSQTSRTLQVLVALLVCVLGGLGPMGSISRAQAATFEVNLLDDDSDQTPGDGVCDTTATTAGLQCTLRAAIEEANALSPSNDTIEFAIPGAASAVQTISLFSALPAILGDSTNTNTLVIDGYTQGDALANSAAVGSNARIRVVLNGVGVSGASPGLVVRSALSTIRGLAIVNFSGPGIVIDNGGPSTGGSTVAGCFIGTNASGLSTGDGNTGRAIEIDGSPSNTIGGSVAARNILVGTEVDGASGEADGIAIFNAPANGNIISNNLIGVGADGTTAIANADDGVQITGVSNTSVQNNVISGNATEGIVISPGSLGTSVGGNIIGLSASGIVARPNQLGINLQSVGVTIGGPLAAQRNVISGNTLDGIFVSASASGAVIQRNLIGTLSDGFSDGGNGGNGISVQGNGNTLGGVGANEGNTIAFNARGVQVQGTTATGNSIRGNSIFQNDGLGIDLVGGVEVLGVTANDGGAADDGDAGPNALQNFPIVVSAERVGTNTNLAIFLDSAPSTTYNVDIYSSNTADSPGPSGTIQGRSYVNTVQLLTDGTGVGSTTFSSSSTTLLTMSTFASLVATPVAGAQNSSEFSSAQQVVNPLIVTNTFNVGSGSLRNAINAANTISNATISFDIPGTAGQVHTITPASPLPDITSSGVTIDGYTQNSGGVQATENTNASIAGGTNARLLIELNGGGNLPAGLTLAGGGTTVRGLAISGFTSTVGLQGAILVQSDNNVIEGCFLGTNAVGGGPQLNYAGIFVPDGDNNLIGGPDAGDRNLISNSTQNGVDINDGDSNRVQNNLIGTNALGTLALANAGNGVLVNTGLNNIIGGASANLGNVISGNGAEGVRLDTNGGAGTTTGNRVLGNIIGLNAAESAALSNAGNAVEIVGGASGNIIGGARPFHNRIALAPGADGVSIADAGTDDNTVAGNIIGLTGSGALLPAANQGRFGISISDGAQDNLIGNPASFVERNTIANNDIGVMIQDAGTSGNIVSGNFIGVNEAGGFEVVGGTVVSAPRANGTGLSILGGASGNTIGGVGSAFRATAFGENVIGGSSSGPGILIDGSDNNQVLGNRIGDSVPTTVAGVFRSFGVSNQGGGVVIEGGATGNAIGGAGGGRNDIGGSSGSGVQVTRSNGNLVLGNFIAAQSDNGVALIGSSLNLIGVDAGGASVPNTILANQGHGVLIQGATGGAAAPSNGNIVQGNSIGRDIPSNPGNQLDGVRIDSGSNNIIGRDANGAGEPNQIAQNGGHGINVIGPVAAGPFYAQGNTLRGNVLSNNGKLGINLSTSATDDSPTPLDVGDGPNNFQAAPILTSATIAGSTQTIAGTLSSQPGTYLIDLYASAAPDPSTYGEGEAFFDTRTVTVPASGSTTFSFSTGASAGTPQSYSVTATNIATGDTSEFSLARTSVAAALSLSLSATQVSEGAGANAATGTVSRNSDTSVPLSITLASSDTSAARVPASVTIPIGATSATFAIEAVDDNISDDAQTATITASASGFSSASAPITVRDNDAPGISIAPTSGLVTTEDGASASFSVALNTAPRAPVTIAFASSDTSEGVIASASTLTFTRSNFATPQTVTIRGVDDSDVDGDVAYAISGTATSQGGDYNNFAVPGVSVSNRDNDNISVVPSLSLVLATSTLAEGTSTSATVRRSVASSTITTVTISSGAGLLAPATVTIAAGALSSATFSIAAIDDQLDNGDRTVSITAGAPGVTSGAASVRVTDNDSPSIIVTPTSGLVTTESGGTSTFNVSLSTRPTSNVSIALSSSDTSEATVSPSTLTFSPQNFALGQVVTVRGVDDSVVDGDQIFTIITGAARSNDPSYNGRNAADASGVNRDNDLPRLRFSPSPSTLGEGRSTIISLSRSGSTAGALTVALSNGGDNLSLLIPPSVSFRAGQSTISFSVSSPENLLLDPNRFATITATARGFTTERLRLSIVDNDVARVLVTPLSGLVTGENGTTSTFSIRLSAQPAREVSIQLDSSDLSEGTVSPGVVQFTSANFSRPQIVTVRGVDDSIADGTVRFSIRTRPSISRDARFNNLDGPDVSVENRDNDSAGLSLRIVPSRFSEAAGARAATGTITRNSGLESALQVLVSSSDASEASVPRSVTIARGASSATFAIAAVDDSIADGTQTVEISARAGSISASQRVAVSDNDSQSLRLSISPSTLVEGGPSARATLTRNFGIGQPLVVALSSPGGLRLPATVTFAASETSLNFAVSAIANGAAQGARDVIVTATTRGAGSTSIVARAMVQVTGGAAPTPTPTPNPTPSPPPPLGPPLQAWGYNQHGQIGDGTVQNRPLVVDALAPDGAIQVAAGGSHSLALRRGGTVFAWGYNVAGQVGDGTTVTRPRAVRVLGEDGGGQLSDVTQIAAGWYHSLALKSDGTVVAWGRNRDGQLGDATRIERRTPVRVAGLSGVRFIAAGVDFSAAITRDGSLWTWGRNGRGQLGVGDEDSRAVPQRVIGEDGQPLRNIVSASLGAEFALALRSDGVALAWGANQDGQLAQGGGREVGQDSNRARLIRVVSLAGSGRIAAPLWRAVAAGYVHTALLSRDGRVFSAGNNFFLQLGRPAQDADGTLRPVVSALGSPNALSNISALSAGAGHTLALGGDGTLRAWGWNQYGTLGDGTNVNRDAPVVVRGLSAVRSFSAGYGHTLALGERR